MTAPILPAVERNANHMIIGIRRSLTRMPAIPIRTIYPPPVLLKQRNSSSIKASDEIPRTIGDTREKSGDICLIVP